MKIHELFRPRTTLIAVFASRRALILAMDHALSRGIVEVLDIGHAALVTCVGDDPPVIVNNNVTAQEGMFSGGMIGASLLALGIVQLGALRLPGLDAAAAMALAVAAGALLGGALGRGVADRVGFGFPPDLLRGVGAQLAPGEMALVLHVRRTHLALIREELVARCARIYDGSRTQAG